MSPIADGVLPLTASADQCSCVGAPFFAVRSKTAGASSPRNQREFNGSRLLILPEGGYRTVRKRQPVSLTLPDHLFNFAGQELIDLSGIIDLAAAIEKLPSDLPGFHEQLRVVLEPCRHHLSSTFDEEPRR